MIIQKKTFFKKQIEIMKIFHWFTSSIYTLTYHKFTFNKIKIDNDNFIIKLNLWLII